MSVLKIQRQMRVLLVWACPLACAVTASAADWPWFLGPTRDGVSTETDLLKDWPEDGPAIVWERETGDTFAAPSVGGGRLILFHRVGDEEVVECLEAASGEPVWRFAYSTEYVDKYGYNGGPRAAAAIADGRVFTFGAEGKLHALQFATGEQIWQLDIVKAFKVADNFFGVGSAPVVEDGRLLIAAGGADGAGLVALEPSTGKLIWKASDQRSSYATPYVATLAGKRRVLHFGREGLVCVEFDTGRLNWDFPFRSRAYESVNAAGPVVAGDQVFVSASYRTGAVLLRVVESGDAVETVWKSSVMGNHWATSIRDGEHLYGFDGRHSSETTLKCIEFATGKQMWAVEGLGRGSLIQAERRYFILSEGGALVMAELTPKGPRVIGHKQYLRAPCWTAPVLSDGRLYICNENRLMCLDVKSKE